MGDSITLKVLDKARDGMVFAKDDMCGAKPLYVARCKASLRAGTLRSR